MADGLAQFFAMGGYAPYVWGSYGLAALVLVGLAVASIRSHRANTATLKALEGARPGRRRSRTAPPAQSLEKVP